MVRRYSCAIISPPKGTLPWPKSAIHCVKARENKGLTLREVEEATRIRAYFLEALEEERFDDLPGNAYARGFLYNYARYLELDPETLIQAYKSTTGAATTDVPRVLDEPLLRRSPEGIGSRILLIVLVVAILALGGWYAYSRFVLDSDPWPFELWPARETAPTATTIAERQPSIVATEPSASEDATAAALPTRSEPAATVRVSTVQAPTTEPTESAFEEPTATPTRAATATPEPSPTATPIEGVLVQMEILEETYLDVTIDGQQDMVSIVQAGEDQQFQALQTITIVVGNAGGVSVTVNGIEVGSLGDPGQVLTVSYDLDNLPQE